MKIFITGGTGFIGKCVVDRLKESGHQLFLLDKNLGDLGSWKKEVEDFNPEVAIHLAWEGLPDYSPKTSFKNLTYGVNLMNFLAEIKCKKIIMAGSSWENLPQPYNGMSVAKISLKLICQQIAKENNLDFIWTRFFFVYGPGQRENSLIPYLIKCLKENIKPEIKTINARNDFIHVEDIANALASLIVKAKVGGEYDIATGIMTSVGDIVKILIEDYKDKEELKEYIDGPVADVSKIKKDVGWEASINIKEGIKKTMQYYGL
jgi:UDP-glucose 4-epimerase